MKRSLLNVLKVVTVSLLMLGLAGGAAAQGPGLQDNPQSVQAALGTGFTYQGELKKGTSLVSGNCDFQFSLWDSLGNTSGQIGDTQTRTNVTVSDGRFTIPNLDFGSSAFTGDARWLQIAVKCAGDTSFNTLTPRQALAAAPYALSLRPGARVEQGDGTATLVSKICSPVPPYPCTYTGVEGVGNYGVVGFGNTGNGIGVWGTGTRVGVKATAPEANGQGIYAEATGANGTGVYGKSTTGIGIYATSSGAGGNGSALRAANTNANGIAIWGTSKGSDSTMVLEHDGTAGGDFIRAFRTTPSNAFVFSVGQEGHITGHSLRVNNPDANGIAMWGTAKGTDSTIVLEHDGTAGGDFIRAFRTTPTNAFVFSVGQEGHITGHSLSVSNDVTVGGRTSTAVLQITGGSDVAERFGVNSSDQIEPGTLMIIDDQHPGKLRPSDRAYDTKVAGVVSGAGGVQPGLTLQQQGVMEGNTSIAIAGRVYVRAEALSAPIEPGDPLTSSSLPGHAMKATDKDRSYGAIIGKAMTGLKEGMGLVLVLVNLQ